MLYTGCTGSCSVKKVAIHRSCCKDSQTRSQLMHRAPVDRTGGGAMNDVNAFQNMLSWGDLPEAHRLARSCDSSIQQGKIFKS